MNIRRLSTGIPQVDEMLVGGIPQGFLVAVVGEPGCGKTIFCLSFINAGLLNDEKGIYVTTEESRDSIINQAEQFNFKFKKALSSGHLYIIDALFLGKNNRYSLKSLDIEELVEKIISIKKEIGREHVRLVIDSLSAFWLDKPAMARRYSYFIKKVLSQWNFTTLATSQYAISTSEAFGWGIEHIADGIIRFRRSIRGGVLRRYIMIEKMRQTPHDLRMYEIQIVDGRGIVVLGPTIYRREDVALPNHVKRRILKSRIKSEMEVP